MNIYQAAKELGVSRRTIYNYMTTGDLSFTGKAHSRQIPKEDVDRVAQYRWEQGHDTRPKPYSVHPYVKPPHKESVR